MHEPDCGGPALRPQRGDEVPCRGGIGQKQIVEGESTEVVGAGGKMHDGVALAHRTHGFTDGVHIGEVTDGSVHARMSSDCHDIVAAGPQRRNGRRAEIP